MLVGETGQWSSKVKGLEDENKILRGRGTHVQFTCFLLYCLILLRQFGLLSSICGSDRLATK